ncbi:hypothetical protein PSE_1099 [Pseudovibrio sp. FO-BEG1]|nr:hypothetical protein PSE_1099 [Pseudovibrio sp. FO-BEG1]
MVFCNALPLCPAHQNSANNNGHSTKKRGPKTAFSISVI